MVSQLLLQRKLGLIDSPHDADHYHSLMKSIDVFTGITWPSKQSSKFPVERYH